MTRVATQPRGASRYLGRLLTLSNLALIGSRMTLQAKVGPTAGWAKDRELVARFEQRRTTSRLPGASSKVQVLTKHRKRLPGFIIEWIVETDLNRYGLSEAEELALRRVMLDAMPNKGSYVEPTCRHLAKLVRYANQATSWQISKPKELLSPSHLTQFMVWYHGQLSDDMYNEARRALTRAAEVLHPHTNFKEIPRGRHTEWSDPSDEEELAHQWQACLTYPVVTVRFVLLAAICLARGAGLRATDLKVVHGTDVVRKRGRVVVVVVDGDHRREVVVLRRFAEVLEKIAQLNGNRLMLEGAIADDGVMEPLRLLANLWDEAAPFPQINRLANAYFLEIAQRRVSARAIFTILRGKTIRGLEDLRPHMDSDRSRLDDDVEGLEDNGIRYFSPEPLEPR